MGQQKPANLSIDQHLSLQGHRLFFLANACEPDAPTRLHLQIARGALEAGAECWFLAWSRGGPLSAEISQILRTDPIVLSGPQRGLLSASIAFKSLIDRYQPHLVHVTLTRPSLLAPPLLRIFSKTRIVITQNGVHEWCEGGRVPSSVVRMGFRFAAARSDRVIAVSKAVATDLLAFRACPPEKLMVIPNGVDTKHFSPCKRSARARILSELFPETSPDAIFLVGAAGNLRPIKSYHIFLETAAALRHLPHMRFVLWGEGEERVALTQLAQRLGLADRLRMPGWINKIDEALAACDCFVHTSQSESFGMAVAEAMASGVAVIAFATGGLVELIEDGKSGFLVSENRASVFARTIEFLVHHSHLKDSIASAARLRIDQEFSLRGMVQQHLQIYRSILEDAS